MKFGNFFPKDFSIKFEKLESKTIIFQNSLEARFIKLKVQDYVIEACLKLEIIGCMILNKGDIISFTFPKDEYSDSLYQLSYLSNLLN